jgi:uncharacterized protein YndB with AHSA1/START domain
VIYDLKVQRIIDCTPEDVFDAFTDPDAQKERYQLDPEWTVETECDVRVGGVWKSAWGPPGSEPYRERSVFQVVDRPRRLVMTSTMRMPDGSSVDTDLEITLEEENGKTRMTIVQSGFPTPSPETHSRAVDPAPPSGSQTSPTHGSRDRDGGLACHERSRSGRRAAVDEAPHLRQ